MHLHESFSGLISMHLDIIIQLKYRPLAKSKQLEQNYHLTQFNQ
jgi:hypothetical protein